MTHQTEVNGSVVVAGGTVRVLVVDDTPTLRMLTRLMLDGTGFEVVGEAGDGLAGVTLATQLQPDLVLLDLAMPVMDGLEALPKVRAAAPRARVVIVSGFEYRAMAAQVLDAGADAYVEKGLPPDQVLDALHRLFPRVVVTDAVGPDPIPAVRERDLAEVLRVAGYDLVEPVRAVRAIAARLAGEVDSAEAQETSLQLSEAAERLERVLRDLVEAEDH